MTNLEKAVDYLFGKQLNDFISYIKIHKLNNSEGPTFLKKTHNMLAGDPELVPAAGNFPRSISRTVLHYSRWISVILRTLMIWK